MVVENIDIRCKKHTTVKNDLNSNLGRLEVTKYLLENKADFNAMDINGKTALQLSSFNGN